MSCGSASATFRLLDGITGWEKGPGAGDSVGLTFDDPAGVTLAPLHSGEVGGISQWLPPPRLARGCGPCEWYLAPKPGADAKRRRAVLLRLDACACAWQPVWPEGCTPLPAGELGAIAASGHLLAVADVGGTILLFADDGDRLIATIACTNVAAMCFAPGRVLTVARRGEPQLLRFDITGGALPSFAPALPHGVAVERLGVAGDGSVWLAGAGADPGTFQLWRAQRGDAAFVAATLAELSAAFQASSLVADSDQGFCLSRGGGAGGAVPCCFDWSGDPLPAGSSIATATPLYQTSGQLLTAAIDSGIPRCVWHRLRIDAEIPVGTSLTIAVASADAAGAVPHPADWQEAAAGALDFLIQQPPGRYLRLRLQLTSAKGTATPRVRRIRIDFPRLTSLDQLPAIYRENADAADFTGRFLALFDASIADLDAAIDRAPALLDAGGVPDDVLPWLASFLGLAFDPAWSPAQSRAILEAIPELYRRRGTLAGLKLAFRLVFDVEPAIEELPLNRPWAALGRQSRTGSFRLFGRDRARTIVGRSALGATTLKSYGDPAADPLDAVAYRFRVLMPPVPGSRRAAPLARVQALVESQKPAHTVASVRVGGGGFLVGTAAAIGVDTAFAPPPAPVLGSAGNVRLNRMSILRRARGGRRRAHAYRLAVGLQPLTE